MTLGDGSSNDEQLMQEFIKFLQDHPEMLQGSNAPIPILFFVLAASFTLLMYDYLITLDEEVRYVWSSPWFIGLPLFYANRYIPFIDVGMFLHFSFSHMTPAGCKAQIQAATWIISIPSFFGQMIIILRTCALWRNDIFIVLFMILLSLSSLMTTIFFTARYMSTMQFAPTPSFVKGCLIAEDSQTSLFIYIALFVTELVIVALTITKAVEHLRQNRSAWVSQLYKNGILYCFVILAFSAVNIILPATSLPYTYKQSFRMPDRKSVV